MEFFDHRPEADLALLKKGFHLGYFNVGNTFGSPLATYQLSQFYTAVTQGPYKLNRRVVLEGLSRGGLYAYNWGVRNPDKVAVLYGDAPVCNFTTWPYQKSPSDWDALKKSYGFPNDKLALAYPFQPVANLSVLAICKVPILHVVGEADEVVPVAQNSNVIEAAYQKLGGTIKIIRKPGVGHHPHGLDDPTPIVNFIEQHFHDSEEAPLATCLPAPNLETRSRSAGWGDRSWLDMHQISLRKLRASDKPVVILGDSIVQGLAGSSAFMSRLAPKGWIGMGLSGDRTQNVLWRLDHGILGIKDVRRFVVMIGINNYGDDTPENVVRGIQAIVERVAPTPVTVVPLVSPGKEPKDSVRLWTAKVNKLLVKLEGAQVAPPVAEFINPDGSTNFDLVSKDGIHLTAKGNESLVQALLRLSE